MNGIMRDAFSRGMRMTRMWSMRSDFEMIFILFTLPHLFLVFFFPLATFAADFTGPVLRILDGETIDVLHNHHAERIRLYGIDCPDKGQTYDTQAKQATSALIFGKAVSLRTHGKDKHGRITADVFLLDGRHVNHELVRQGWCWWYRKSAPGDGALEKLENEARLDQKGIWVVPMPLAPWERQNR